jgi:hypothetical protein
MTAIGIIKPLWDNLTGKIGCNAVIFAYEHGYDSGYYLATNWATLGPKLIDKLNVYEGDTDNFYLNLAVYQFHDFLKLTENPHYECTFEYGRPIKGHGWQPIPTSKLLQMMAQHITENGPKGLDTKAWRYL